MGPGRHTPRKGTPSSSGVFSAMASQYEASAGLPDLPPGGRDGLLAGQHARDSRSDLHQLPQGAPALDLGLGPWFAQERDRECLSCHQDQRKHLYQRSVHPIRFGQMGCTTATARTVSPRRARLGTHRQRQVLGVPRRDARSVPLGACSRSGRLPDLSRRARLQPDKMLKVAAPRLCQSCHLFGHHQTVPGFPTRSGTRIDPA